MIVFVQIIFVADYFKSCYSWFIIILEEQRKCGVRSDKQIMN